MSDFLRPHGLQARQASLSFTISQSLLTLICTESVMPSNHLIFYHPLLLSLIFPSISLFQWVNSSHQVAKVLALQAWYQSFQWIFRVDVLWDWLVSSPFCRRDSQESSQNTTMQKPSILWCSAFFMVQLSDPYMKNHTGKTIALTRQTFDGKEMSLLFNMLSRLAIAFLPRSKRLLISWLYSPRLVLSN